MGSTFNSIRRILFGWANREFLIFLFFLAVAGVFWLLTTLNESFEKEVKIPVRFINVPPNTVIISGEQDTLRVTVRDKGISLVTYFYNKMRPPIDIDFKRYALNDGKGSVPSSDLLRLIDAKLPASAKAISVKPEEEVFYYNDGENYMVPVVFQGQVEPDKLYFISNVTYTPNLITIYPSKNSVDSISRVYTEPVNYQGFRDSLVVKARLKKIEGVKMVPDEVTIHFNADMLTEVTIENVPITGINMPEGKKLRTFPAKLSVSFVTGMKNYQTIQPSDFLIVADYHEFSISSSSKCNVYLRQQPASIQRVKLEANQVDYLIEESEP